MKRKLLTLEIPEDPDRVAEWLEGHLMGLDLHQLVAELQVMRGGSAEPAATLKDVLGDEFQEVLQVGLRSLSKAKLNQLIKHPKLLVELQGLVLNQGGEHWTSVPPSDEVADNTKKIWSNLKVGISQEVPKIEALTRKGNTMPKTPNPDWRNTDANASETTGARGWQARESQAKSPKLPSRRFVRGAIVLTCLVGIAIGIGWLISLIKGTRPACLVVVGSGYEDNLLLPHNVYGWNGAMRLLQSFDGKGEVTWVGELFGQRAGIRSTKPVSLAKKSWSDTWQKIVKQIKEGTANERVILYFSAHGYADEKDAYLLRDVPDIKSPQEFNESRVPFSELLESIKKDVHPDKGILLLLEVCHVQSHWPIGMLKNDFVERIQNNYTDEIKKMGNLTVICSTSPGQRSWAWEERQTTIFADYVSEGLQGNGGTDGGRVTALGLFKYVQEKTNQWVKANRARAQSPIQIGGVREIELVTITSQKAKEQQPVKDEVVDEKQKKDKAAKANSVDDLKKDWETWKVLKRDYAPQVYCPHYWRLYQETLLRYEQLVRAGDPTKKAGDLKKKKLDTLADDIKKAKALNKAFDCLGNSFPLWRVLGFRPEKEIPTKALEAYLAQLEATDAGPRQKTAANLFVGKSKVERQYWQTRLGQSLLQAQIGKKDRAGIRLDLAKIAKDLGEPERAVETHLVKMLQLVDPAVDAMPDLIPLALRVRMLAEEAALGIPGDNDQSELYAETIFKRIQKDLEEADKYRREGEDRLFGDPKTQAVLARNKLILAREGNGTVKGYARIREDAQKLRSALALRDDIAAELPFLAASLAVFPSVNRSTEDEIDTMRKKAEALGESLARLTKSLDKPDGSLPELKEIVPQLEYLRKHYRGLCETLRDLAAEKLQLNWHAIDAALSVPPATAADDEVELRIKLLTKLSKTSRNLAADKHADPQAQPPEDTMKAQRNLLRACLKPYDEQNHAEPSSVDDDVRKFFLTQFNKAADETADLENESGLTAAAARCRVLLGSLADNLRNKNKKDERINPANRLRNLRTYHLLHELARRTLDDHWYDPGSKSDPTYYGPAAKAYLESAAKILEPKDAARVKERKALEQRLAPAGLLIPDYPKGYWTTEISYPVTCKIGANDGVPAGRPSVWFEVPQGKTKERQMVHDWPAPYDASVSLNKDDFVASSKISVTLHALYRGQHETKNITIECPPPDIIARHTPGPDRVGFAVRMEKLDYGAISIVLDNSGSMGYRHPTKKDATGEPATGKPDRFDYAIKALEQVLKDLPADTYLSISTFDRSKPQFIDLPDNTSGDPYYRWQPSPRRIKEISDDLKRRFEKSSEYKNNASPIANALIRSMEKGFPATFDQPKLVVVLTDGMDNYSSGEYAEVKNKGARARNTSYVKEKLRDAKATYPTVDVVVVCFIGEDDLEIDDARAQFDIYKRQGRLIEQPEGDKLARVISNRITPHVQLQFNREPAAGFADGQPVNYLNDPVLSWHPLKAKNYKASLINSIGTEFDVNMASGHNIFATLRRQESKYILERAIVGLQPEVDKNALMASKAGWLVTLLQNERPFGSETRSQLVAFEKSKPEPGGVIRQDRPGFVWMELETQDGKNPKQTIEWGNDVVVPAAAYAVEAAGWPGGDPKLTAWFWPRSWEDLLTRVKPIVVQPIDIKNSVSSPGDLIESVRRERRAVGVMTPKGRIWMDKECLVVRARYHEDKPVYVGLLDQVDRLRVGSEHQFFHGARKCTACFYDPPPEDGKLVVIDIAGFKAEAVKGDTKVEFMPRASISVPSIFRKDIIEAIYGK